MKLEIGYCHSLGGMDSKAWNWVVGLIYIVTVASIWIAASFVVQSVVDAGVSPFLITYICNSLFIIYIPMVEIGRYVEDRFGSLWFWRNHRRSLQELGESEQAILLEGDSSLNNDGPNVSTVMEEGEISHHVKGSDTVSESGEALPDHGAIQGQVDAKGRWTRRRVAKVSLLVCPFWFLAQLTFNLSLKYTTVTVCIQTIVFRTIATVY